MVSHFPGEKLEKYSVVGHLTVNREVHYKLLSGHLYDLHVVDSPACQFGFDSEDINHFFFNCPLFGAERTELLTNLLTLGIANVNLSLLLIGCDDYEEELNKNIFKFVHHFIPFYWKIIVFYNSGSHGIHIVYVIWYLISWYMCLRV